MIETIPKPPVAQRAGGIYIYIYIYHDGICLPLDVRDHFHHMCWTVDVVVVINYVQGSIRRVPPSSGHGRKCLSWVFELRGRHISVTLDKLPATRSCVFPCAVNVELPAY